ncbi:glycosyltransferase family 4 protein [Candidatus Falkowbacteria bacterium]|jgi:glycosyltransferase involved in cell wall biosynthesis|nr:glycosyltransferase family 4 protein [Candidatus Falkowbacteria bacterium]MBT5503406.1 glycosyltransferase family 4 protein [Candidatus Falkowbacteria bacterium]MBT6574031.1 glycosyltransferase family 4 protein [Candidatus Falkowbacteria bacterium]MBT7348601.1 glycosyltransferase family 4 protein [Candidatus Falkowbacteria bacterium]MBT7500391.1 glycosyltransferase family 4 protein [Candidatus Falkowbacteria bacterium]
MIPETRILITKFPFKASLSGVEKHTFSLVKNLEGKGVRFFLLASCPVMLSEFKKQGWPNQRWWLGLAPETRGSKVTFLFSWPLLVLSSLIGLVYCRYKFKIEKLYCLGLTDKLIMTPVALLLGYKVIWPEALSIDPTLSNNIYRFLYKWWSSKVDVVAISHFVKQELENLGVKDVIVIRHGVEPTIFKKQEDLFEMMAEKRSVNYEKRNFTVGCVARLDEIKGLEYLIKAVDILKDKIPNIDLIIVGEGPQRKNLQWLTETFRMGNKVKLVGYKDNFLDWIYDFDVFVLPSLKESLGITLIQAMACSKPVISTLTGGIPEVVEHGKNGILVEVGSPQALAKAILLLYKEKDIAQQFVEAGLRKVKSKFLLSEMLDEYKKVLLS